MKDRMFLRALLASVMALAVASCANNETKPDMSAATPSAPVKQATLQPAEMVVEKTVVVPATVKAPMPVHQLAMSAMPEADVADKMVEKVMKAPVMPVASQTIPPNTFLVNAAIKNPSHLFYGIGSKVGMVINGEQGKELVVVRGQTYTFKVDTGVKHDFYLSKSAKGWGAATLADGVKGNFTYKGVVTFSPDAATPDVVYYQCRNHKNMGSKIHVVNKGGEAKVVFGIRNGTKPGSKQSAVKSAFTKGNQAKQKIKFADMFIAMSPAAKRIDDSDHAEARQMLAEARVKLDEAKVALAAGNDNQAIAHADAAMRSMSAAAQRVPSETELVELRSHYDELLKGAHSYEKSYLRNLKKMKKKGKKNLPDLDVEQINTKIAAAEKLADNNQYAEANKMLTKVQRTITGALTQLLADETMDYTLTFDNPQEKYEYELSRYNSFAELVPIAIEQKNPAKQTLALMQRFVEKAEGIYALSGPKAKEGDIKTAIQMLQGATSHMQRALRIIGVR